MVHLGLLDYSPCLHCQHLPLARPFTPVCSACVVRPLHCGRPCPTRERDAPSIEEIFAMSDDQLFSKINSNSLHNLQQFMPDRPSLNYSLRARPHNKTVAKTTQLHH